jgi:hypothetical protein
MKVMHFGAFNAPRLEPGAIINTFRVGRKWARDLQVGEVFALAETGTNRPLGLATVSEISVGSWDEVKEHAGNNQTWRGSIDPQAGLQAELKEIYDTTDGPISVIHFMPALMDTEVQAISALAIADHVRQAA